MLYFQSQYNLMNSKLRKSVTIQGVSKAYVFRYMGCVFIENRKTLKEHWRALMLSNLCRKIIRHWLQAPSRAIWLERASFLNDRSVIISNLWLKKRFLQNDLDWQLQFWRPPAGIIKIVWGKTCIFYQGTVEIGRAVKMIISTKDSSFFWDS